MDDKLKVIKYLLELNSILKYDKFKVEFEEKIITAEWKEKNFLGTSHELKIEVGIRLCDFYSTISVSSNGKESMESFRNEELVMYRATFCLANKIELIKKMVFKESDSWTF